MEEVCYTVYTDKVELADVINLVGEIEPYFLGNSYDDIMETYRVVSGWESEPNSYGFYNTDMYYLIIVKTEGEDIKNIFINIGDKYYLNVDFSRRYSQDDEHEYDQCEFFELLEQIFGFSDEDIQEENIDRQQLMEFIEEYEYETPYLNLI
jgi:hypothetical protein